MIARCPINNLSERGKFFYSQFLKSNGVDPDLFCELRYIEHLFLGLTDIAVNKVSVTVNWIVFEHLE